MIRMRPLPRSFLLVSMFGLLISGIYTYSGRLNATWGITLLLIFGIMFAASLLSMTPTFEDLSGKAKAKKQNRAAKKTAKKAKKSRK